MRIELRWAAERLDRSINLQTTALMNGTLKSEKCRVCGEGSRFAFAQEVLGRTVHYFDCSTCGYVQTQMPDWLDEAYSSAINSVDTGIMVRNRLNLHRVVMTLLSFGKLSGKVIDHAGGYGILVRMLRDVGVDARWRDKYCANLLARGFEATGTQADLLTAFEVFEHLVDPVHELASMLAESRVVLLSTDLIKTSETPRSDWWYYGPEHGQHIGFFRTQTLRWMAKRAGCHHDSDGATLHLFSREPIPWHWRSLVKLWRLAPLVSRARLRSKTNSDFNLLREPLHDDSRKRSDEEEI